MKLFPNMYYKNIQSIPIDVLLKNNIQGIILDVDNTLIDLNKNMPKGVQEWVQEAKKNNIKPCILSNSNKKEKIETVAKKLDIPFIFFAKKPLGSGFKKAKELLKLDKSKIASIGDQIFTDVLGANLFGITSIFVEPISKEDYLITKIKRPIEECIIKKYKKKNNIN